MPLIKTPVDYTDRDLSSMRTRMFQLVESVFPDWSDREVATFGNIMVELKALVHDHLGFYQDNQAKEAFLEWVEQRKNALAHAKRLVYNPAGAKAASAEVLFALDEIPDSDYTFDAGTVLKTADVNGALEFQLLTDLTIPAGTDPPQAFGTVEHSKSVDESFSSSNLVGQKITLSHTPFLDGSEVVAAANGDYEKVDNFLSSGATDRHYIVVVDENDRATIQFGNGINGELPTGTITVDYKYGGGTVGNVAANTITRIVGHPGTTVTNPSKADGGDNRESVEEIKINAPANLRVLNRTVAREDFEVQARTVPGVARALMLTSDQNSAIAENRGYLYIVPTGSGEAPESVLSAVDTAVTTTKPHTITFRVTVVTAVYKTVDVRAVIYLEQGADEAVVGDAVRQALTDWFAVSNSDGTPNTNVDFGFAIKAADGTPAPEIPLSDIFNVVRDVSGVRKIGDRGSDFTLNEAHEDLALALYEFPRLGTVTIVNGATGKEI